MDPKAFLVAKTLEMRQRHTKHDNTPYALEPNCKGVTRRLARPATHPVGCQGARIGRQLERTGRQWRMATPFEVRPDRAQRSPALPDTGAPAQAAGRRRPPRVRPANPRWRNRLATARKHQMARLPMRASETLMRRYYWAAKAVSQLSQILLLNIEERLNPSTQ